MYDYVPHCTETTVLCFISNFYDYVLYCLYLINDHVLYCRQMGDWLKVNGEAVYSSIPWTVQNDTINSKVKLINNLKKEFIIDNYSFLKELIASFSVTSIQRLHR